MAEAEHEGFMEIAWAAFIRWASQDPEVVAHYREATGRQWPPSSPQSGLEAMIDKATGYQDGAAEHFVIWATRTLWGEEEAPERLRRRMKELGDG